MNLDDYEESDNDFLFFVDIENEDHMRRELEVTRIRMERHQKLLHEKTMKLFDAFKNAAFVTINLNDLLDLIREIAQEERAYGFLMAVHGFMEQIMKNKGWATE